MEHKQADYTLALKSLSENGCFAGYASVFNVPDSQQDIVLPGAFADTLSGREGRQIKLLWQHHMDEPIGVITQIYEDQKGLYVEGQLLLDVQRAREAYSLLKSGAIDGLSIGYTVKESDIDPATGWRMLRDIALWEVSLVTIPANQQAGVVALKQMSLPQTIREFEHFLRDAGFSRKSAKAIAAGGFSVVQEDQGDADSVPTMDELVALDRILDRAICALN